MPKVIAVNCSPRKNNNTAQLVAEAARGAEERGAEVEVVNLYDLDAFMGCRSCFACKTEANLGKCVYKDGLADLLAKIREADGLILGTPNYFGRPTAGFRALFERLVFQYLSYKSERPSYNDNRTPVLLIMTSNVGEENWGLYGYSQMLKEHKGLLDSFIGPVSTLVIGDTQQVTAKQYERFGWTAVNGAAKVAHHDKVWDKELARAFEAGEALL